MLRDLIRPTDKKDLLWGAQLTKGLTELAKSGISTESEEWKEALRVFTKFEFSGLTPEVVLENGVIGGHKIAKLLKEQMQPGKCLGEFSLKESGGKVYLVPDKCRPSEDIPAGEERFKTPWIKIDGNASSGGPNLWFEFDGDIMNICQLTPKRKALLMKDIDALMPTLTDLIINMMVEVCSSGTSAAAFKANGFNDEEIELLVRHMNVPGAMDLLLTMQASNLEGQANTSVPRPHMQTNLGFTDAYLSEHPDLATLVSRMMKIFQEQMTSYIGQYVTPF